MPSTKVKLPLLQIGAALASHAIDPASRIVPCRVYTGVGVLQFSYENGLHELTLSLEPGAVKLDRLAAGAPFTKGHRNADDPDAVIGKVLHPRVSDGELRVDIQFSRHHPDSDRLWAEVQDGVLSAVSVEAAIHKMHETTTEGARLRSFVADSWEPSAVSLVASGADPHARINAADQAQFSECEVEFSETRASGPSGVVMNNASHSGGLTSVTTNNADAELSRRSYIADVQKHYNLSLSFADQHIRAGTTKEDFNAAVVAEQMRMSSQYPDTSNAGHITMLRDESEGRRAAMVEALAHRYVGGQLSDQARQYAGARISDLARICCEANGVRMTGFDPAGIIKLSMQNAADFPYVLEAASGKMLLSAYQAATSSIKTICRPSTAADFKSKSLVRLSEAPSFLKVPEGAQITIAGPTESKETYALATYGRGVSLTRQALVNDDLGAFNDLLRDFGQAAAALEAGLICDTLYGPAGVGPAMGDGKALFHTDHNNLNAAPGVISDTTLTAARLALRTATGLDGTTIIECPPKFLVIPPDIETLAEKYLATLYPAQAADVNPFTGKLQLVVVPQLKAHSASAWYVFSDPAIAPTLEYSYLDGANGPQFIRKDNEQGILGMQFYAYLDFACGAIGWRGCYKGNA